MNTPYKIPQKRFSNIYFASDFHYNHEKDFLWKPRGFQSSLEHDLFLEEQCSSLKDTDLLVYLGDFSLNSSEEKTAKLFNMIPSTIFYCFGNHESQPKRMYKKALKYLEDSLFYQNSNPLDLLNAEIYPLNYKKSNGHGSPGVNALPGFINFFGEECYLNINGFFVYCRHMAPAIFDKMKHDNYVCLCGHSHGNYKQINPETSNYNKILDVGVDNAIKYNKTAFFSLSEVIEIMSHKTINIPDHHGCTE